MMRDYRKQRSQTHEAFNFVALCAGVVVVLGLAVFSAQAAWGMYTKFAVASRGDAQARAELADTSARYAKMSASVGELSTARGEEGQIRERFGMAKPGEGSIQIVRSGTSTDGEQNTLKEGFWSRVFHAFVIW